MEQKNTNKIAVTADIHLSKDKKHQERYDVLLYLLDYLTTNSINNLIIAGDLFDKGETNYKEFEEICKNKKYKDINFYIIPGNHDFNLTSKFFTAKNINIIDSPQIISFSSNKIPFLLLPYKENVTMGNEIGGCFNEIKDKRWILVGHGDYIEGRKIFNPYEEGLYMPLTRSDILKFNPFFVFLGHIHKPFSINNFYYPGSPYPLHRNETGKRRFLVFDIEKEKAESISILSNRIYYNEKLILLPFLNNNQAEKNIKDSIRGMLSSFNLDKKEEKKIKLTLDVGGYTTEDKAHIKAVIKEELKDKIKEVDVNMEEVGVLQDVTEKTGIVQKSLEKLKKLEEESDLDEELKRSIEMHILQMIYSK